MGKASVVIYTAIAALILFLLVSRSPPRSSSSHRHRRLKLRSNFTFSASHHSPAPFDPLVSGFERRREDKLWERHYIDHNHPDFSAAPAHEAQPEWEEYMDAEDYLNDEERFNVTARLADLFPKIDVSPADGFVSGDELIDWNYRQSLTEVLHRTKREMDTHDKNRDGFVSFAEYDPPTWSQHADNSSIGYETGWWKQDHFNASDADGDGLLSLTEFNDFLHPADSKNPKLIHWLCKEEVRERDTDKDGKVNFKEFFNGLFDMVRNYDDDSHNISHHSDNSMEAPAKALFSQLDSDGDGYLSDDELRPVIEKLHPSEHYYAKQQSDYIISQADTDKDGRLSLAEMIDNPYVFYSAIFSEEEEEEYHDEFR